MSTAVVLAVVGLGPAAFAVESDPADSEATAVRPAPMVSPAPLEAGSAAEIVAPAAPPAGGVSLEELSELAVTEPPSASPAAVVEAPDETFDDSSAVEVVAERQEKAKTFRDKDGVSRTKLTLVPQHYRTTKGWEDIDNTLVSGATAGTLRNKANAFRTDLAAGRVAVESSEGTVEMIPLDGTPRTPVADRDGTSATYRDVWPGVDLRYTPESNGLKEEIVVNRKPASNRFAFRMSGASVAPDGDGLRLSGGSWSTWQIAPLTVLTSGGATIREAAPTYSLDGDVVTVEVDDAWLQALPESAFPIVIDPTLHTTGAGWSYSIKNTGERCEPCPIRVGNPAEYGQWNDWRGFAYFPYEHLLGAGRRIVDAGLYVGYQTDGSPAGTWLEAYHATTTGADSWSVHGGWLGSTYGWGDFAIENEELRAAYDSWFQTNQGGAWIKFLAENPAPDWWNYKQLNSFELDLYWTQPPQQPVQTSPGYGPHAASSYWPQVTLGATVAQSDADYDTQDFELCEVQGGVRVNCSVVASGGPNFSYTTPTGLLWWNRTYEWRSIVRDNYTGWLYGATYGPWWQFQTLNRAPSVPGLAFPSVDAVVDSTSLTLSWDAASDPDGDSPLYDVMLSSSPDPNAPSIESNYAAGARTWALSSRSLSDGGTYYWFVRAKDGKGGDSAWSTGRRFRVDRRLGVRSTQAYDDLGGAKVNLSNGNLVVAAAGPSFPTVGGPVGIEVTYNSQAPLTSGLDVDYIQDLDKDLQIDTDEAVLATGDGEGLWTLWGPGRPAPAIEPAWYIRVIAASPASRPARPMDTAASRGRPRPQADVYGSGWTGRSSTTVRTRPRLLSSSTATATARSRSFTPPAPPLGKCTSAVSAAAKRRAPRSPRSPTTRRTPTSFSVRKRESFRWGGRAPVSSRCPARSRGCAWCRRRGWR